jgi:hypothetical protein
MLANNPVSNGNDTYFPDRWKAVLLRVAAVYIFVTGSFSLYSYFARAYLPFIASGDSALFYFPAALRMTCRLGYPIAAIPIFFLHRWGVWLLVIVWLAQLVPSSVYMIMMGGDLSGNIRSLIEFVLTIGVLYLCRSALKSRKIAKPILTFFASALALHSALFFTVDRAPGNALGHGKKPRGVDRRQPRAVNKELDPECPPYTRCKPITFAAENGNLATLKKLLDAGADPDGDTSYGDTPLIIAIMNEHRDAVDLLLQYKADVNKTNRFGASAFTGVAAMGDVELAEKFIKHGADVDQTFPFNNPATRRVQGNTTPLSVAVQLGHTQVVKLLLQNKADPYIQDSLGKSAADYANASENAEMKEIFMPYAK